MHAATPEAIEPVNATIRQGAQFLNVSETTVWRMVYSKVLRSVRFGRAVRIPWDELERVSREGFDAE